MTKTTPAMRAERSYSTGPWYVGTIGHQSLRVFSLEGPMVADCNTNHREEMEKEANARLIAASPAMLEALQALMNEYKQRMDGDYPGENLHQFQSAYKMARAAISAATGEAENGYSKNV